jgi:hypothetical protein
MAHSEIHMTHPHTGQKRKAPVGFSWTSLFFGPIPCMMRQDWLTAIVIFCLSVVLLMFGANWILWLLQAFFYNKYYVQKLVEKGYLVDHVYGDRSIQELENQVGVRLTHIQDHLQS